MFGNDIKIIKFIYQIISNKCSVVTKWFNKKNWQNVT